LGKQTAVTNSKRYVDIGLGNRYRKLSQYPLMREWERRYKIESALQAPYDPYINDDQDIFSFPCVFSDSLGKFDEDCYDLVFNFAFVQRYPSLIGEMKRVSRRLVAAFAPNVYNFGSASIHPLYHKITRSVCHHIQKGDKTLMTLHGLRSLFRLTGLTIIEEGYVDIPPWFHTVFHLTELFGCSKPIPLELPMPRQLVYLEKFWPHCFKRIHAHHIYVVAKK